MREKYKEQKNVVGTPKEEETLYPYIKLATIVIVIIAILSAMWFWGLAIISNLDAFWKIFNPGRETAILQNKEKTPPPPYLAPLEAATKEKKITVKGYSLEGILVKLFLNDREVGSARADKEGSFSFFNVELDEGSNSLYVKADAGNGVESIPSKTLTVKYLKKAPLLEVSEPPDRAEFRQKDNTITIRGKTDPSAIVTINGQKALVTSDGTFTYLFPLSDGENKLTVESADEAGNKTTVEKIVSFSRTF